MPYSVNELKTEYNHISISEATPEVKNAIEKLKTEKAEDAVDLIRMMLVLTLIGGDNQLAEKINASQYKSLSLCFSHIKDWAKKRAIKGCAAIDHEEVLSEAIHYYIDVEDAAPPVPKQNSALFQQQRHLFHHLRHTSDIVHHLLHCSLLPICQISREL